MQVHLDILLNRSERPMSIVADCIALIRTRLLDFEGQPAESSELAISLVQQAVEEFSRTGQILSKVTEASVFRPPFYVNCFLPILLSPASKCDVQRLVEQLHRYVGAGIYHIIITN